MVKLEVWNNRAKISGLAPDQLALIRHDSSYQAGEEGTRTARGFNGVPNSWYWDGYKSLITAYGIFSPGLVSHVKRLLWKYSFVYEYVDYRVRPAQATPIWTNPPLRVPRDYQQHAIDSAWAVGRGVIDSPPRSGKTLLMLELLRKVAGPTVIVCPTIQIAAQTYDRCLETFGKVSSPDFYLLTGGAPKTADRIAAFRKAFVFVATAETASNMPQDWWAKIACLMVDERHHQTAETYNDIGKLAVNAYYRWGFTGTNYRSDHNERLLLESTLGETVCKFSIPDMLSRGVLVPARVEIYPIAEQRGLKTLKFQSAYAKAIVGYEPRNQIIADCAKNLQREGRKVIVLCQQIAHGTYLASRIPGSVWVEGSDGTEVRRAIDRLDKGEISCLVGSPVIGEGLDCPTADALIYAKGMKAKVTHRQDVFRVLTGAPGKKDAIIVDFADRHNRTLIQHSLERLRNYVAMGASITIHD